MSAIHKRPTWPTRRFDWPDCSGCFDQIAFLADRSVCLNRKYANIAAAKIRYQQKLARWMNAELRRPSPT